MTLGERLQQLRKEKQMSQEELGNLLLVSRQTVSLWENNQTVPTVDNLIRLREIFGVSIDSILTGEEPVVPVAAPDIQPAVAEVPPADYYYTAPVEKYFFSLYKKDLKYIYKISTMHLLKKLVIWIFLVFFSIFVTFTDSSEEKNSYFVFFLAIIFFCLILVRYILGLVATKKNTELLLNRNYTYEMFRDYMLVRIFNAEDEIKTYKVYFNEFTKCWETPYCYFLELKDRTTFTIKKTVLSEYSPLRYFCQQMKTDKTDFSSEKITFLKTAGKALFICCFLSLFTAISMILDSMPESAESSIMEALDNLRIFHYFLPVPILSIIVGILLNKNKIRNRKNIVVGIIIGLYMLIFGFVPAIFGNVENNFSYVEATLGFDFPECISFRRSTSFSDNAQTVTSMSFTESASNEFETTIKKDSRWSSTGRKDFYEILPESIGNIPCDLFLIYNVTTDEFGKLPDSNGEYEFIYISYDTEMNTAYIFEYTADYQK
ncbi:MAG: helix-turn-helix transcriptional regulator [Clostridia bacterium]|nr:helix-turn-helix transcriptional regulator [Clostridia bacterium]